MKNGLLVQTFHDTSGRRDPLVIKCRWNGKEKEFQAVDVQLAKRYHTSFDCAEAKTEVEKAVCDLSDVAFLDVKVDEVYKSWLDQLNPADSDTLVQEQKAWLRKRDVICGEDWDIDHCLEELYRARLRELGHFKSLHRWTPNSKPRAASCCELKGLTASGTKLLPLDLSGLFVLYCKTNETWRTSRIAGAHNPASAGGSRWGRAWNDRATRD